MRRNHIFTKYDSFWFFYYKKSMCMWNKQKIVKLNADCWSKLLMNKFFSNWKRKRWIFESIMLMKINSYFLQFSLFKVLRQMKSFKNENVVFFNDSKTIYCRTKYIFFINRLNVNRKKHLKSSKMKYQFFQIDLKKFLMI